RIEQRISLLEELAGALTKDQVVPYYKPKICQNTGRIEGLEILARWNHPERGILTPAYFGEAFDDPRLALALNEALLARAVTDIHGWLDDGLDPGRVAFNLSSCEFSQPDLAEHV